MPFLHEIDITVTADMFIWRYSGIPEFKMAGLLSSAFGDVSLKFNGIPQLTPEIIGSVLIDGEDSTAVDSDAALFATKGSHFYDYDDGCIRFNLAVYENGVAIRGHQTPIGKRIRIGLISGYCDVADYSRADITTYNGIFFDPRIKTLPTLSAKMDDLDYGIQMFNDWNISHIGSDGDYEGKDLTACNSRLRWVPDGGEREDGKIIAAGKIQKTTDGDDFAMTVGDVRRNLENNATLGTFSLDDFPHLDDGDVGKVIPMFWNKQTKVSPICVNKLEDLSDSATGTFRYCLCATSDAAHSVRRVNRVYSSGSSKSQTISSITFGTWHNLTLRRSDGMKATLAVLAGETTDLAEGTDYTLKDLSDGFQAIKFNASTALPSAGVEITVFADSDDNNDVDIEADITSWTATLFDPDLKIAYIDIPAEIAYDGSDSPMDILVDMVAWSNTVAGESEWLNGADIVKDALKIFAGYEYDNNTFAVQSWEMERVKCVDKSIHVSPCIEDDTTINDIIGQVAKSCLMLVTVLPDGRFDLRVDSVDIYPQWKIEAYQRMEMPSPAIDISNKFSWLKVQYGTAGDSDKKTYTDTTYKEDIKATLNTSKSKEIDTIISDEASVKKYCAMVYERTFDLTTFKMRDLIEVKVPALPELLNVCPTKAIIIPHTRAGSLFAAYTITSVSRPLGDELITITGRKRYDIEYDAEYTQGVICDDFICDAEVIGATTIDAA